MKNYYQILEVNRMASLEIIERAHSVLVQNNNPELYSGSKKVQIEAKLQEINEAYRVLSNSFLKEQYDAELEREEMNKYNYLYGENQKLKEELKENKTKQENIKNKKRKSNKKDKDVKIGSLGSIIELCKELLKNKPKIDKNKKADKKDVIALVLTIVIVLIMLVILWFIPFTNQWVKELLFMG